MSPTDDFDSRGTSADNPAERLVEQLTGAFAKQIHRALGVDVAELTQREGDVALAYVDHYLSMLGDEDREPIVSLVAAGAGAWFGELIRREIGATWIGDGKDPRRLRLLLEPDFIHISPVDLAYSSILAGEAEQDPRLPAGPPLDVGFHLRKLAGGADVEAMDDQADDALVSDHAWVMRRLAELPPMPEHGFHSLTVRYETLKLILELLATRHAALGLTPTRYHLNDYVAELTR